MIQQLYPGKTSNWNRGGHAYWAPDGRFQGINKTKGAVGIGKWHVTSRNKLCQEANWRKAEGGAVKAYPHNSCRQFVTAAGGTERERYLNEKGGRYRHKRGKQANGNTQQRLFRKISQDLGLYPAALPRGRCPAPNNPCPVKKTKKGAPRGAFGVSTT